MPTDSLKYLSRQTTDSLYESVHKNLERYKTGNFIDLAEKGGWSIDLSLRLDLTPLCELVMSGDSEAEDQQYHAGMECLTTGRKIGQMARPVIFNIVCSGRYMRFFMLAIAFLVAFSELAGLEERSFSSPMTTSVIIPCHYMHFYLIQDLLTQFERQTAVPDEVVISLARSHYEKLDQAAIAAICGRSWAFTLKVVLAEDAVSSPGKNRNRACECSSGDLLICQDADDIPHPQRIEIIKHLFEHYRVDARKGSCSRNSASVSTIIRSGCVAGSEPRLLGSGVDAEFGKPLDAGLLGLVEFGQRLLEVAALLAQVLALFLDPPDHQLELPHLARRLLVHLDDFADLVDREAEPLAAQDLPDEMPV